MKLFTLLAAVLTLGLAEGQSTFTPARPPAIPIAVRSPYLSSWLHAGNNTGNGGYLAGIWAQTWQNNYTSMAGLIKVDNKTYEFMGFPSEKLPGLTERVKQTAFSYTSTRSTFTQTAGPIHIVTTLLSPVTPNDLKRQSIISTYVNIQVSSLDGKPHDVKLYTDITAEWVSQDPQAVVQWSYGQQNAFAYHKISRQQQLLFTEKSDQAEWGDWFWTADASSGRTYQSGGWLDVRRQFISNGKLTNTNDTNFRAVTDNYPTFAWSFDLGNVQAAKNTLFTLGIYQDQAIQFQNAPNSVISIPSLWTSYWPSALNAASFFHTDYSQSSALATTFDQQVDSDSKRAGGQDYATITTLAVRQAFGGGQLVGNLTKQYFFIKEISSDGNIQTVDVIYPSSPIFYYANADWVKYMIDPVIENQESGAFTKQYCLHDLGSRYPNATGHPNGNEEMMPLEESSNIIILAYAYALKANDTAYLKQHYPKMKQWNDYLVGNTIAQGNQLSTDDFAGKAINQTNLAYKGVVAIASMGKIAKLLGNNADAANFTSIANNYINQLNMLAYDKNASQPHTWLTYSNVSSWNTLYNLFADRWVKTNVIPQAIYDFQSAYYPSKVLRYGLPLDSRGQYPKAGGFLTNCKADWEMFAASVASTSTKSLLISKLATWINETTLSQPFPDLIEPSTGGFAPNTGFRARPVVGGTFALLALQ